MSSIFPLTVTEAETTETVVTSTKASLNLPPVGTLMRATLGNTSIEFHVKEQSASSDLRDRVFYGTVDGTGHDGFREVCFWVDIPWVFEILDEPFNVLDELEKIETNAALVSA